MARRWRRSPSPGATTRAAGSTDLRDVGLEINGDDLLAAGVPQGPEIGARLQRALDRKLDGEIAGREQELATALAQDGG